MSERLYRSRDDRMLAGVAGGLAELWDADPSLVRIVWALLVIFTGGLAFVVYIVMAIVVPEEGAVTQRAPWPGTEAPWPGTEAPWPSAGGRPATAPVSGSATTVGTEPAAGTGGAMGFTDQPASVGSPPTPPPSPTGWVSPPGDAREARRQARAARRTARRDRGGVPGGVIGGLVLVAIGGFFLARQFLPEIDFDWFWPLMLVGLGILLIVTAVARRPDEPGGPS
jgi:phage shock protein C